MSFKLLAIRPLDGCDTKFLKNLEENRIYQFYNEYEFLDKNENPIKDFDKSNYIEVDSIKYNSTIPNNLYGNKINISAIVGKNGSGKSSLVELLYVAFYNLSVELNIIKKSKYQEKYKKTKNKLEIFIKKLGKSIINSNTFSEENKNEKLFELIETLQLDLFRQDIDISNIRSDEKEILETNAEIFRSISNINFQDKIYTETEWNYIKKEIDDFLDFSRNSLKNLDHLWSFQDERKTIDLLIDELENEFNKIRFLVEFVSLDFFFLFEESIFCIHKLNNEKPIIIEYIKKENHTYTKKNQSNRNNTSIQQKLFYNLVINYSLYGLNSVELGNWIKRIFHENDGYQTPIVINPFRNNGNIDINSENELVRYRLLTNMIINDKLKQVTPNNHVSKINITIKKDNRRISYSRLISRNQKEKHTEFINCLAQFFKCSIKLTPHQEINIKHFLNSPSDFELYCLNYILKKLRKITQDYSIYSKYNFHIMGIYDTDSTQNIKDLLLELSKDSSHISYKIRQTINFIFLNRINEEQNDPIYTFFTNSSSSLDISYLSEYFNFDEYAAFIKNRSIEFDLDIITLLPPPIFEVDFVFDNESTFSQLSSGEKQQIFSLNSILYHLINLNSTRENDFPLKYPYINLILDEIELYAHPDMQRKYIKELLDGINKLDLQHIFGLNILFITHSPFILSDIPKQNILYLKTEERVRNNEKVHLSIPQPFENKKSFGANITDLLADSFFIDNGLMGDFAKAKIEDTIKWINLENYKKDSKSQEPYQLNQADYNNHKQIIELIDEPILKMKLAEMIDELKGGKDFQKELARKEIDFLKSKFGI